MYQEVAMVNILLAALYAILLAHVYRLYLLKVVTEGLPV